MIQSVAFHNFRALRNTMLPLGSFSLIVGPNGSGKSTALKAFEALQRVDYFNVSMLLSAGLSRAEAETVRVTLEWGPPYPGVKMTAHWWSGGGFEWDFSQGRQPSDKETSSLKQILGKIRLYALDATAISNPVSLNPNMELGASGNALAVVLDQLRDCYPERFEALNDELGRLLPEFDRILFETPAAGCRAFLLRTREGYHPIRATDLSQGTLLALAILTIAYLPDPPPLVGLEEPDRGIHPRLLRHVRDALYRLSYPESFGEKRSPVQVVATTHSPYFLDLFRDRREEVVIAQKDGLEARFERLVDRPDVEEILGDAPLGEVWYSGVLGGVPS